MPTSATSPGSAPGGRSFQVEEDRTVVLAIVGRDANANHVVVGVAQTNGDVRHIVRAPPLGHTATTGYTSMDEVKHMSTTKTI